MCLATGNINNWVFFIFQALRCNSKAAFFDQTLPALLEEVGIQFANSFVKSYLEIVELSEDYAYTKVKHDKLVAEIKGAAQWAEHKSVSFGPSRVNSLLREYKQYEFTEVFFWEEDPPALFIYDFNYWCFRFGRTDLIFDLSLASPITHQEYLDALEVRLQVMKFYGYQGHYTDFPEFSGIAFYQSLNPFAPAITDESD